MDLQHRRNVRRRLYEWRKEHDLTLQEISDAVSQYWPAKVSTISNYQRTDSKGKGPSAEFIWALGKAYPWKVDVMWLLYGDDQPPRPPAIPQASEDALSELEDPYKGTRVRTSYQSLGGPPLAVDHLLSEVYVTDLRYQERDESGAPWEDPETPIGDLDRILEKLITAAFEYPQHFVTPSELNRPERITYVNAALVALRPLLRAFYRGERSVPQKPPNKEDAACTEVTND